MWKHIGYSRELLDEIIQMTREQYGPENDISDKDFLQHQYFENPVGDALIDLAVDEKGHELAGQYVVWPMRYFVFGKDAVCTVSLNTLTRTNYRGQGIFTGLAEITYAREAKNGHAFCYGAPNPNSYPGFIKKLSFVELGRMPLFLRPLCPSHMVKEFLHTELLSTLARPFDPCFRIRENAAENIKIVPVTHGNVQLIDLFWAQVKGKYPVMNIRDADFVCFRYLDMPRRDYHPFIAMQDGTPVAFAVGRIMEVAGMQCGMLADFLFVDGYEIAAKHLLTKLLHHMQVQGASLAGCLMFTHTQEAIILKKSGFFRCPKKLEPQPFPLILRLFDKTLGKQGIYDVKNWFFTMGDYDVI